MTTKHFLPIGKESMTHTPIRQFVSAGITEILVVASKKQIEETTNLPGSAETAVVSSSGCRGLRVGLPVHRRLVGGLQTAIGVIPGDDVLTQVTGVHVEAAEKRPAGARILFWKWRGPERSGTAPLDERNWMTDSNYGGCPNRLRRLKVCGVWNTSGDHARTIRNRGYGFSPGIAPRERGWEGLSRQRRIKTTSRSSWCCMYGPRVPDMTRRIKPPARGELEINSVDSEYPEQNKPPYIIVNGKRRDSGTFEPPRYANTLLDEIQPGGHHHADTL